MHLLRNSADHGLESAEVRKARGKNETGSIFLDAYQDGNNVIIEVRDDGNGIDVEAVRQKAIERGTISLEQAENMTDKDIVDLLFLPSFSTAKVVSMGGNRKWFRYAAAAVVTGVIAILGFLYLSNDNSESVR